MTSRVKSTRKWVVATVAISTLLAACASSTSGTSNTTVKQGLGTTSSTDKQPLTDSFRGVTKTSIKVGIMIIDQECIKDYVDSSRGPQQQIAQAEVDDINSHGGVLGRKIIPVFKKYCPIPGRQPDPLTLCTSLTDDDKVFAVLGVFIDFSGDGQKCLTKDKATIMIGHEINQFMIDAATPGLLLTPDTTKEGVASVAINLAYKEGKLSGKVVATLGDQDTAAKVNKPIVLPLLKKLGVKTGSPATISISGTDTSAAQAQMDGFIEKWKTEKVNAVFISGNQAGAKQFVEKIKKEIPDALLMTDVSSISSQAKDETSALKGKGTPNPYEGMLSADGQSAEDRWAHQNPLLQNCIAAYQKATGDTVLGPDAVKLDKNGDRNEVYVGVTDFCGELTMLKSIAERAGANLTNDTWIAAVNAYGPIKLVPTDYASLCTGKYAADDAARLVSFDSSIGAKGDWKPLTPIGDSSNGACKKSA